MKLLDESIVEDLDKLLTKVSGDISRGDRAIPSFPSTDGRKDNGTGVPTEADGAMIVPYRGIGELPDIGKVVRTLKAPDGAQVTINLVTRDDKQGLEVYFTGRAKGGMRAGRRLIGRFTSRVGAQRAAVTTLSKYEHFLQTSKPKSSLVGEMTKKRFGFLDKMRKAMFLKGIDGEIAHSMTKQQISIGQIAQTTAQLIMTQIAAIKQQVTAGKISTADGQKMIAVKEKQLADLKAQTATAQQAVAKAAVVQTEAMKKDALARREIQNILEQERTGKIATQLAWQLVEKRIAMLNISDAEKKKLSAEHKAAFEKKMQAKNVVAAQKKASLEKLKAQAQLTQMKAKQVGAQRRFVNGKQVAATFKKFTNVLTAAVSQGLLSRGNAERLKSMERRKMELAKKSGAVVAKERLVPMTVKTAPKASISQLPGMAPTVKMEQEERVIRMPMIVLCRVKQLSPQDRRSYEELVVMKKGMAPEAASIEMRQRSAVPSGASKPSPEPSTSAAPSSVSRVGQAGTRREPSRPFLSDFFDVIKPEKLLEKAEASEASSSGASKE